MFKLRWQQFLASAATVAVVNAVVGGAFVGLVVGDLFRTPAWLTTLVGGVVAVLLAVAFLRYQWRVWMRVAAALPIGARAGADAGP